MATLEELEELLAQSEVYGGVEGDPDAPVSLAVAQILADTEEKRDAFAGYIKDLEHKSDVIRDEVKALEYRARRFEKRAERLKHLAALIMVKHGHQKLVGALRTMTLLTGKSRLVITCEDDISNAFKRQVTYTEVNKEVLKEALETGVVDDGAHLETGPDTIRVYS